MHVDRIEITDLAFVEHTGRFAAHFCLHMTGRSTGAASHAYLIGQADRQPCEASDSLAARLLGDVRRQMEKMPEFLLGQHRLTFQEDLPVQVAA